MKDLAQLVRFLGRVTKQIRFSRPMIVAIVIAGAVAGLASTAMIALVNAAVRRGGATPIALALAFAALCAALPACRFVSQALLVRLTQRGLLALRLEFSRRVLAAPLRHLETIGAGRILATLTQDVSMIIQALAIVPLMVMHVATVVGCLVYLGWLSWTVLLEFLGLMLLGIVAYQFPLFRAVRHLTRARDAFDEVADQIRAMTEGTKELKMHRARRRAFLGGVETSATELQEQESAGTIILAAASSFGQVAFFIVIGLLVLLLPRYQAVSQWTLIAYTIVLFQIMVPLEVLLGAFPILSRAVASVRKVGELGLSLEAEPAERESGEELAAAAGRWGTIELAGVTHAYRRENENESFLLGPIDLVLHSGELIFLVGSNGSGKTTLAKLLIGLYAPEAGEIRYAGRTVTSETLAFYREQFAVVFADYFVFKTLFGLAAGRLDDDARRYLSRLDLESKVTVVNGALSTVDLSQGQRKRLALLTAYLEDRPIYLFDEWAADQDPVFKEIFYRELLPELKARGKTVVVITHDDRYFHLADRIVKLDCGQVAASWSQDEPANVHGFPETISPQPLGTSA